jgi:hypothetical protein
LLVTGVDNQQNIRYYDGRMRKRGKYGLTNATRTYKIGGFLPFIVVHNNLLNGSYLLPGNQDAAAPAARQKPDAAPAAWIQTPETPEKHQSPQLGIGPLGFTHRARRGTAEI